MFTPDFFINSVQSAQTKIVETFVTNDSVKKELIKLIDAQTEFVKGSTKNSLAIAEAFWKNASNAVYAKAAK